MSEYAKVKALDDLQNLVHARHKGTQMDTTECGLKTAGFIAEVDLSYPMCMRAVKGTVLTL
jgi:hypothetical protein